MAPDDLLSIIGSTDPTAINRRITNIYQNCKTLIFSSTGMIGGMIAEENEQFDFVQKVKPDGKVVEFMNYVDEEMLDSLWKLTKEGVYT